MIVQVAAFLLLCFAAAFLTWPIVKAALRQRRREAWPKVTGTVIEQRRREEERGIHLEYLVSYEYDGEPVETIARDWSPGVYTGPEETHGLTAFREAMQKRLDLYTAGAPIPLMVNPSDPAKAFYRRGRTWPLFAIAAVVALVFVGLIAALTPVIFEGP